MSCNVAVLPEAAIKLEDTKFKKLRWLIDGIPGSCVTVLTPASFLRGTAARSSLTWSSSWYIFIPLPSFLAAQRSARDMRHVVHMSSSLPPRSEAGFR